MAHPYRSMLGWQDVSCWQVRQAVTFIVETRIFDIFDICLPKL